MTDAVMDRPTKSRRNGNSRAANPSPAEILCQAAELRAARPREQRHYEDGTAAQQYAAAVLGAHTRAIHAWSKWWMVGINGNSQADYLELLGYAMLAQAFFQREGSQLIDFDECCRLLRTDREVYWQQVWQKVDPTAWCWLCGLRALEMMTTQPVNERQTLAVQEWQPMPSEE